MPETSLITPLTAFSPNARGVGRLFARIAGAPARWLEARAARAELAGLSEREWLDIGAGARDPGPACAPAESADERAERRRAVRAWYAKAA